MRPPLPPDASLNGHLVDGALRYVTVATGIFFVIMAAVLLTAALFHRQGRRPRQAHYTHGNGPRDYWLGVLAAAAMFFGVDTVLLARSTSDLRNHFWRFPDGDPAALR